MHFGVGNFVKTTAMILPAIGTVPTRSFRMIGDKSPSRTLPLPQNQCRIRKVRERLFTLLDAPKDRKCLRSSHQ
jgi:hypothetical protein